jgi:large subunit ribosomal protein L30
MDCIKEKAMNIKVKLVKSAIGCPKDQKDTVRALGLKKLNSEVIKEDTEPIKGMIFKVKHLVSVEEVK